MGRVKDEYFFSLIRDYLTIYLPVQRKASLNTVVAYRIVLDQLLKFISDREKTKYASVTFDMVSKESINAYLDFLTEKRHLSPATRNNRLAAIKSFLSYAAAMRPEYISLMDSIASIKMQKDDPFSKVDYLSESAVKALLNAPDISTQIGLRDQFFMIMLYDTEGRIQEILDIRVCDIKLGTTPNIILYGKGKMTRVVPLMTSTVSHLLKYMKAFHANETWNSQKWLFYSVHYSVAEKICDDTFRVRLNHYAKKAQEKCPEVPDTIHPHLWRHTRAMHLYQHGMDLTLISQWLGHKQLTTTLVYAHADTEAKRLAIEKAIGKNSPAEYAAMPKASDKEETIKKLYGLT